MTNDYRAWDHITMADLKPVVVCSPAAVIVG